MGSCFAKYKYYSAQFVKCRSAVRRSAHKQAPVIMLYLVQLSEWSTICLIFHIYTSQAFEHSNPLKSSPGILSLSVCDCRHDKWLVASGISALGQDPHCHIYAASASRHLKLVTVFDYSVATPVLSRQPSHGNKINVRDVIIAYMINGEHRPINL